MSLGTVQKNTPLITRVAVDATEDSVTLREQTRAFLIRCQDFGDVRVAFVATETADSGDYLVLRTNDTYWEDDVYSAGEAWVIYLRAPNVSSGTVGVTVLEWT